MKKTLSNLLWLIFLSIILVIIVLSTIGIETKKFNNLISQKINQTNKNVKLGLDTVFFKLDIKEVSLFLETKNPIINYRNVIIPANNIKVYIDFFSIIKSDTKIDKLSIAFKKLDINQIKRLSFFLKPSKLGSLINSKIKKGQLDSEIDFFISENNTLENFIARGSVSDLNAKVLGQINLKKTNFSFFADNTDILIKSFNSEVGANQIKSGDLRIKLAPTLSLTSNFKTKIDLDKKEDKFLNLITNNNFLKKISNIKAEIENNIFINFDKTFKIERFNYKINGKILKANLEIDNFTENIIFKERIKQISVIDTKINSNFSESKNMINISGKYSFNEGKPLKFSLENNFFDQFMKLNLDLEYGNVLELEHINYSKQKDEIANILINMEKKNEDYKIKEFSFKEQETLILFKGLEIKNNKFNVVKQIYVKTFLNGIKNNDFSIDIKKDISINGSEFDATNLPKILENKDENLFSNLSKNIEIDLKQISAPLSEKLKNFKLIGKIKNGKFVKINSKGEFGKNKFLDITMKDDKKTNKKYLEIYSDSTKPLLTEYNFFKGLTGGKLLYSSIIGEKYINSKLKIEDFKVVNAPGMVKLLSLADLGGLADLAEGEGISFDTLEIQMEKSNDILKLNEILAIGPSVSVLMEGYQDKSITSLKGTLVPAKTLNKMISKIPVIGDIVIPKEVGEGLFGISFKLKGPPGEIKMSINPIRTITPRFIQKIIDKNKKVK
tara:strand:+ start:6390 stop:8570 length:2181 start_codon:yes stop_codon:yes gene_type:complete